MTTIKNLATELLYRVVMTLLSWYKKGHFLVVKLTVETFQKLIIKKFSSMGITVGGSKPWDMQIHDKRVYERIAQDRSLGLGESYMNGWWDCEDIEEFFSRITAGYLVNWHLYPWQKVANFFEFDLFNMQASNSHVFQVAREHYDLGNELFQSFLDPSMTYTCGYWKNAKNLAEAQKHKMDLIGQKLKLKPGMRVLDIGCGWGGLCKFLAEKYGVTVVGCTIGKEGVKIGRERCQGLPVDIRCIDYREMNEKFDRIVSVGMFEHVGNHNFDTFFEVVDRCLEDNGLFLLHTIGIATNKVPRLDNFYDKYIFPHGRLPYQNEITEMASKRQFVLEDWHNFGTDYCKTLRAWNANFVQNWPTIQHLFQDPNRFFRMWTYYLQMSAGGFKSRHVHLWQVTLSKNGFPGGYESVR